MSAERDASGARDALDKGLAAAFGNSARAIEQHASVLKTLQARTKSKLGVHLDSEGPEAAPVKVTDEVKALRDPAGRYQLLGEIGRGGMGVVYKGRDQDLGRDVAMKVLKDEYATRADVLARFVEEAQIGGQLQHPGIVPVYELGLQAGERPYFAMKLVKGETLAAQLAKRADATQERRRLLGVFEQVCQTIAYAHARHVVHRDLKPANVMIGAFGEVQVVDWGFAKVLQKNADDVGASKQESQRSVIETARSRADSGSHSVAGSMMGTPAYMPPEQALGDIARVDERSDVFALGAILCEVLTGDAPYREQDGDLVRQAAKAELDGAYERLASCGADEALIALSKECLAPSQRARPASAGEVAERVSAYLTSVEERARQAEVRAAEARLKHRVTLISAGAGVLVLALAAGGWLWLDAQARTRRNEANQRVASAMNAASGARGRAQSSDNDTSLWSTAVASAEQLVSLAKSDDVDTQIRSDAEALLAAVQTESRAAQTEADRRKRDADMLAQLELARIPADEDARATDRELHRLDGAYAAAFAKYLGDVSLLEPTNESALALLRRGDIEVELAGALDDWGLVRDALQGTKDPADPAGTARIREIAKELDTADPWRTQLRALLPNAAHESAKLRELAEHADFSALTAVGCRVLGQALWNAGEQEAAIAVLRRGQELHSQDFDLCFQLAMHLDMLDPPRRREAIDTYRIAHAIRPEIDEVIHRQLLDLFSLGEHVEEERLARLLVAHTPSNSHWPYHLGLALAGQARPDDAIASLRRAIELNPKEVQAWGELGQQLEVRGDIEEAITALRKASELAPKESLYAGTLGRALAASGNVDEAQVCLRKAIELDPKSAPPYGNLGDALANQGRFDEALECYRKVIELDPKEALGYRKLADTLKAQGHLDEALAWYRKAVAVDPKDAATLFNFGCALGDGGLVDEAIEVDRKALELDPRNPGIWCNLGNTLMAQGNEGEAIASYRKALELDPKFTKAHDALGVTFLREGRVEEAIDHFRTALELEPNSARLNRGLGAALMEQGQLDEALAYLRRATELDPRSADALNSLAILLTRQGDLRAAVESLERAVELEPGYGGPRINLGARLLDLGYPDRALTQLREAAAIFEQDSSPFGRHWLEASRGLIADAERDIARLDDVLAGSVAGSSNEWNAAIQLAYNQKRYREAVELSEVTLRDAPELIDEDSGLYNSACCAALLAASADAAVTADERVRARSLARAWLSREVERRTVRVAKDGSRAEAERAIFEQALAEDDFANVRGAAIDALPEGERAAWRDLWKRIEAASAK